MKCNDDEKYYEDERSEKRIEKLISIINSKYYFKVFSLLSCIFCFVMPITYDKVTCFIELLYIVFYYE